MLLRIINLKKKDKHTPSQFKFQFRQLHTACHMPPKSAQRPRAHPFAWLILALISVRKLKTPGKANLLTPFLILDMSAVSVVSRRRARESERERERPPTLIAQISGAKRKSWC